DPGPTERSSRDFAWAGSSSARRRRGTRRARAGTEADGGAEHAHALQETDGAWVPDRASRSSQSRRQAGLLGSTSFSSTGAIPKSAITVGAVALFLTPS